MDRANNNSLERTRPQRSYASRDGSPGRSARGRYAAAVRSAAGIARGQAGEEIDEH